MLARFRHVHSRSLLFIYFFKYYTLSIKHELRKKFCLPFISEIFCVIHLILIDEGKWRKKSFLSPCRCRYDIIGFIRHTVCTTPLQYVYKGFNIIIRRFNKLIRSIGIKAKEYKIFSFCYYLYNGVYKKIDIITHKTSIFQSNQLYLVVFVWLLIINYYYTYIETST